jgi:hypothetical protein
MKKRIAFLSGTGLVSLHLIDASVVDVEPGASLARHLPWMAVTVAVAAAAALSYRRLSRASRAAAAGIFGVLAASVGAQHVLYAGSDFSLTGVLLVPASALLLFAGAGEAWGMNRDRAPLRAWAARAGGTAAALVLALVVVAPLALAVTNVHKPRAARLHVDLGAPSRDVSFRSTDGVRLHALWAPGRNGAAVVLAHGGGGDVSGVGRQARILTAHGYGVLAIDARGRGRSEGDQESFGWHGHQDVSGGVTWLRAHGVRRIGALGLSTGANAVIHAAARDSRIDAVVADGAGAFSRRELTLVHGPQRLLAALSFEEYRFLTWSSPPPPLQSLVPLIAPRPLLLIAGTPASERAFGRAYFRAAGEPKALWETDADHTAAAADRPREYAQRVLATFDGALAG